jgi:hypothetical protein
LSVGITSQKGHPFLIWRQKGARFSEGRHCAVRPSSFCVPGELITVRAGKVTEMVVYPTVEDALAAARLAAGSDPPASR